MNPADQGTFAFTPGDGEPHDKKSPAASRAESERMHTPPPGSRIPASLPPRLCLSEAVEQNTAMNANEAVLPSVEAATRVIHYEQPLNERMRNFLRLDFLYQQAVHHHTKADPWSTRAAVAALLEILAITQRGDVRGEVLKELELISCSQKASEQKGPFLAKVGNATITQADYDREFKTLPEYALQVFSDEKGREKFLNEIVNKEMLYQEALKKGLEKTPDFQKKLEEFKKLTLVTELFEKEIMSKASVSDQELKDYYDKHKEEFTPTIQIKASHILVRTEDEAKKVLERLEKGEKFGEIAKAVSIDKGSAKNGGDLAFFSKGQMVPEFEKGPRK